MQLATSSRQLSFAEIFRSYPTPNPSETIPYKVVKQKIESFLQLTESDATHKGLPDYVKKEFYAYLDCGILAKGFLRLQCAGSVLTIRNFKESQKHTP